MRHFDSFPKSSTHPYAWLWEPFEIDPSFFLKPMFGSKAVYIHGKLQLCFFAKRDPWRGVLVCTEREHQPSLMKEFPSLAPHPVLSKWLYLPETVGDFESTAQRLVKLVGRRDTRIGVEGSAKESGGRKKG